MNDRVRVIRRLLNKHPRNLGLSEGIFDKLGCGGYVSPRGENS